MADSNKSNTNDRDDSKAHNSGLKKEEHVSEQDKNKEDPAVTAYFNDEGTPVEASTIPPKGGFNEPNLDARPDVHEKTIRSSEKDALNEDEIEERRKQD